jgi:hypothetical protein
MGHITPYTEEEEICVREQPSAEEVLLFDFGENLLPSLTTTVSNFLEEQWTGFVSPERPVRTGG